MKRWGGDGAALVPAWKDKLCPHTWQVGDECYIALVYIHRTVKYWLGGVQGYRVEIEVKQSRPPLRTIHEAVTQAKKWLAELPPEDRRVATGHVLAYEVITLDVDGDVERADPPPPGSPPLWTSEE